MKILAFDVIMVVNMIKEKNFKAFKKLKGKLIGNSFLTQVKHCWNIIMSVKYYYKTASDFQAG